MSKFQAMWAAAAAWGVGAVLSCAAQGVRPQAAPLAPAPQTGAAAQAVPQAGPRPTAAPAAFPAPNPKNFTASSPSKDDVDSFLKALWGYDANRTWQVQAIQKTRAAGVSRVVVLVGDKTQGGKTASTVFFTTPDGQHAIADNVIDFGPKPFAANRALLEAQADGPGRGAAGKELLLVEFADLQCPSCREAQSKMDSLVQDFPQARVVFENFPLGEVHPFAMRAASMGECVRRSKGEPAFFTYAQAVYDSQDGLTAERGEATLAAAVTKAGGDPAGVAACASTPAVTEKIAAQMKLGTSLGVDQTPMLAINGHLLPLGSLSYDVLKKIVAFQAVQDGLAVQVQPTLTTLK